MEVYVTIASVERYRRSLVPFFDEQERDADCLKKTLDRAEGIDIIFRGKSSTWRDIPQVEGIISSILHEAPEGETSFYIRHHQLLQTYFERLE